MHFPAAELEDSLSQMGWDLKSKVLYGMVRDEHGRLPRFKIGDWFVYIIVPYIYFPKTFQMGILNSCSSTKDILVLPYENVISARNQESCWTLTFYVYATHICEIFLLQRATACGVQTHVDSNLCPSFCCIAQAHNNGTGSPHFLTLQTPIVLDCLAYLKLPRPCLVKLRLRRHTAL